MERRADSRVHAPNESWGFPKFCQRSDILDNQEMMLPNGALTIMCEIGGFKRIANKSDYQRVREQFDPSVLNTLSDDLSNFLANMEHADFHLVCKGEKFPCHKFMLSARSDVFRAMFQHENVKEVQRGEMQLEDADPPVVKQFIEFLYTDKLADTRFPTVSRLLPLAEKYNVKRLSTICGQYLLNDMDVSNVSEIAVLGALYGVPLLRNRSIEFISQYPERVMKTDGWAHLLKQAPEVCTNIIFRLARTNDKEVTLKANTKV